MVSARKDAARRPRLVLWLAALASSAPGFAAVAATTADTTIAWSDWKSSNDPQIQYRYRVHGSVMARLQLKSSSSSALTAHFKWRCASANKFVQLFPEGYITVPAQGVSAEQTLGVQDCADPTPSSVEISAQPQ